MEKPQHLNPDGAAYPVTDFPGPVLVSTRPDPRTLHTELQREDGTLAGGGTMIVSGDGQALKAVNFGFDSQLREFKLETIWDRSH